MTQLPGGDHASPPKVHVALAIPQQRLIVELIGKEEPILDGFDDALGQTANPRVTRQPQSSDDRSREHQNPAVLLNAAGRVFHGIMIGE